MIEFTVEKEKTIETLVYIASRLPNVGRFHAGKIIYFADRDHLRRYGRPITGDRMIAMDHGPVPSLAYDILKKPSLAAGAIGEKPGKPHPEYVALREPDLSYFSKTDLACLDAAIEHCRTMSFGAISDETHKHKAWIRARENTPMAFDEMLDGVDKGIVDRAQANATYGVM